MPAARLHLTSGVEEQWHGAVRPWLLRQAAGARRQAEPVVVLTPGRALGFHWRGRLVEEGVPLLGLRFWTPSDLRAWLAVRLRPGVRAATQADLRLIARACAEELLARESGADEAVLRSVAADPSVFLRGGDLLQSAGWDPAVDGLPHGRRLAAAMARALRRLGAATQPDLHRRLLEAAREAGPGAPPRLAALLVAGFNAAHWPLWDLLRAAVAVSREAEIVLQAPLVFGQEIDQLWISSWEESAGVAAEPPSAATEPSSGHAALEALAAAYERGTAPAATEPGGAVRLHLAPDPLRHAQAVTLEALACLREPSCRRLGIVFPGPNALALEVAEALRRLGLPLDNGIGAVQAGLFERRFWLAWLELQREPSLRNLLAWIRACDAARVAWTTGGEVFEARTLTERLDGLFAETLVDDLRLLADFLERPGQKRPEQAAAVARFLRERPILPERATPGRFLEAVCGAAEAHGWREHLAALRAAGRPWLLRGRMDISRAAFLEWLREETDSRELTRGAEGNHFYGRVHLVTYGQAVGQSWTHLILTGLNEGVWPAAFSAQAFGSRHDLALLNRRARELNAAGRGHGTQGFGHETAAAGRGHCLLPQERADLALRDLCVLAESTSEALVLTAAGGDEALPSDFFGHAYQAVTGRVLDDAGLRALAAATEAWCRSHADLLAVASPPDEADLQPMREAFAARRDEKQPFGIYEFAHAEPPARPIQFSCQAWESALDDPARLWIERVVGAVPWPEGRISWVRTIGSWVHLWLRRALRETQAEGDPGRLPARLEAAIRDHAVEAEAVAARHGFALYPWWRQIHAQAEGIAFRLAEALRPRLSGRQILSEHVLPDGLRVALREGAPEDFALTGRADLILVESPVAVDPARLNGAPGWIVDFKTGSVSRLTLEQLRKGRGLQAFLYGWAVRRLGAGEVRVSLQGTDLELDPAKALDLDEALRTGGDLFRSLDLLHRRGVFGQRPAPQEEFGHAPEWPLAHRPVPLDILQAKWDRLHGGEGEGDVE